MSRSWAGHRNSRSRLCDTSTSNSSPAASQRAREDMQMRIPKRALRRAVLELNPITEIEPQPAQDRLHLSSARGSQCHAVARLLGGLLRQVELCQFNRVGERLHVPAAGAGIEFHRGLKGIRSKPITRSMQ